MPVLAVVGCQWGDEGKGKIVDILAKDADSIARYQGGHNAGHTVIIGANEEGAPDEKYILHLLPSGIIHPDKKCYIGNGMVVDPKALAQEIAEVESKGISVKGRLFVSERAHLILPYHHVYDRKEEKLRGSQKIGTTGRGIGPAYADKSSRIGIRVVDLLDEDHMVEQLRENLESKKLLLNKRYDHPGFEFQAVLDELMGYKEKIAPYIHNVFHLISDDITQDRNILIEGAQGVMLDIDHGTYPYVTSSNSTVGGACTGLGIPPASIKKVLGVIKAYTTRVGEGPFPTELKGDKGNFLREKGKEFGATTGRPRRCGWFDGVVGQFAVMVNGITDLALTKLDVLDDCQKINVCVGYKYKNVIHDEMPASQKVLANCEPVYQEYDGWMTNTTGIDDFNKLPDKAKIYVEGISKLVGIEFMIISTGQKRDETIILKQPFQP